MGEPGGYVASVLVVDDEADARELLRRTLEAEGYRVVTARSGAEALDAAREIRPGIRPILVIDDDPDSQDLLSRTLEADGYVVVTASTGDEGLELLRAGPGVDGGHAYEGEGHVGEHVDVHPLHEYQADDEHQHDYRRYEGRPAN